MPSRDQLRRHHLTPQRYESISKAQRRACAVCRSPHDLYIDHDHSCCPGNRSCGKCVRGLLCHDCNTAEGFLGSSAARALDLSVYLTPKAIGALFVLKGAQ